MINDVLLLKWLPNELTKHPLYNFVLKVIRKSTKNDLVQYTIHIKLNNIYEKAYINELKILSNDVHLVKSFPFFKNRVCKLLFNQAVAKKISKILSR